ncbi:MAG: hypothetical protein M5F18_01810 [Asgard group archaeon]|nr:hypothetical protein [Asgard group archaeon]
MSNDDDELDVVVVVVVVVDDDFRNDNGPSSFNVAKKKNDKKVNKGTIRFVDRLLER